MTFSRRDFLQAGLASALPLAFTEHAAAQGMDLARIVFGFPVGGSTDAVCRRVADKLQPAYARAVMVESRVGGGGQVVVQSMKTAPTDGSTILMTPMSILGVYPHTYKRLGYDPLADLVPVSRAVSFNHGIAVGPAVPESVKTVPQFMDWCRENPSKASFGTAATGSVLHFLGILLGRAVGVELTHVGYRGSSALLTDTAGGNLPACLLPVGDLLAYQSAGRIRVIGTSGGKRSRFMPNVPTFTEAGYKDMAFDEWYGFYLPARTPQDIVQKLNTALASALKAQDVSDSLAIFGLESSPSTPAELDTLLRSDTERWRRLVKSIGFTSDT